MTQLTSIITDLPNLGPKSSVWLTEIWVTIKQDILDRTPENIYLDLWHHLGERSSALSANMIYALEWAATDTDWKMIPDGRKQELKNFADDLRKWNITID